MTKPRAYPTTSSLPRVIGVSGVALTAFNCVVGVGIFGLPGLVAAVVGSSAIFAYVVCLVLIGLIALCLAEAGSRVSDAGGVYAYASSAFGPVVGGVAGALFLFASLIGSTAALARFFMDTLASVWPIFAQPILNFLALVFLYGGLALINIRGTRDGNRLTITFGILKFVPLALLVIVGAFSIEPANLTWTELPAIDRIGDGALILFFAFIGIESGLSISGETRNPARTIPRAVALALGMVALLYIGLQTVTQGVLGAALATSQTPLVDTAGAVLGPWGAQLLILLTLVSAGGYLAADMLGSPRIAHALAHSGQLPRVLRAVHPRFATPSVSIAVYAASVIAVAASGSFRQIAVLAVAGTLVLYLICCLGVLRLRAKNIAAAGLPFVAPGGPIVPVAAAAIILWLLSTLAMREMIATLSFVVIAALIYYARYAKMKSQRSDERLSVIVPIPTRNES
jgi:basic amino acid/polyamine antiporter, APA family